MNNVLPAYIHLICINEFIRFQKTLPPSLLTDLVKLLNLLNELDLPEYIFKDTDSIQSGRHLGIYLVENNLMTEEILHLFMKINSQEGLERKPYTHE